jgi:DNA-directed RNA polymerase specialized sigma24 family protein
VRQKGRENRVNARELLESYGEQLRALDALERELAVCRRRAKEDGPGRERNASRAQSLSREAAALRRRLIAKRRETEAWLCRLPGDTERKVLALRYLELLSYDEISEICCFSPRHVFRIHRRAVLRLQSAMEGESLGLVP